MSEKETSEKLTRPNCPALDEILGVEFPVLDNGFIRVIDYMGDDRAVVQAARVSYGTGTKKVSDDEGLIRYLMRHAHSTPSEMAEIKFHIRIPMDAWRQFIRHRTANVNEYSTRYSEAIDEKQTTAPDKWRLQAADNKQGSGGYLPKELHGGLDGDHFSKRELEFHRIAQELYKERIDNGIAKEQARKDLPLSSYTEAYWKCDLHNLLHFSSLRMDSHAQEEIRAYANVIGSILEKWVPLTWAAFNDYNLRRGATLLSARDVDVVKTLAKGDIGETFTAADRYDWLGIKDDKTGLVRNRERLEFEAKLEKIMPHLMIAWQEVKAYAIGRQV